MHISPRRPARGKRYKGRVPIRVAAPREINILPLSRHQHRAVPKGCIHCKIDKVVENRVSNASQDMPSATRRTGAWSSTGLCKCGYRYIRQTFFSFSFSFSSLVILFIDFSAWACQCQIRPQPEQIILTSEPTRTTRKSFEPQGWGFSAPAYRQVKT